MNCPNCRNRHPGLIMRRAAHFTTTDYTHDQSRFEFVCPTSNNKIIMAISNDFFRMMPLLDGMRPDAIDLDRMPDVAAFMAALKYACVVPDGPADEATVMEASKRAD